MTKVLEFSLGSEDRARLKMRVSGRERALAGRGRVQLIEHAPDLAVAADRERTIRWDVTLYREADLAAISGRVRDSRGVPLGWPARMLGARWNF